MDIQSIRKAYRFYAPIYDFVFGAFVNEGRKLSVSLFRQNEGDRILECGVGTGLSLPFYNKQVEVYGIDVSKEMLDIARKRFQKPDFPHVKELIEMDAQELEYPDNYFQGSVAMYVASVVPDPAAMMRELFRVTEPGGPVLVVNHFSSNAKVLRSVETRFARFSKKLGFRPDFCLENFSSEIGMEPERVTPVNVGGYWKVLEYTSPKKNKPSTNLKEEAFAVEDLKENHS